jgi:hypothetical protein
MCASARRACNNGRAPADRSAAVGRRPRSSSAVDHAAEAGVQRPGQRPWIPLKERTHLGMTARLAATSPAERVEAHAGLLFYGALYKATLNATQQAPKPDRMKNSARRWRRTRGR